MKYRYQNKLFLGKGFALNLTENLAMRKT